MRTLCAPVLAVAELMVVAAVAHADETVRVAPASHAKDGIRAHSMLTHDGRRMVSRVEGTNTVYELVPTNRLPANLPPVREWREDDAVDAALRERRGSVLGCACNCVVWQKSHYDFVQTGPKVGTILCCASCATCDNLVYYARL